MILQLNFISISVILNFGMVFRIKLIDDLLCHACLLHNTSCHKEKNNFVKLIQSAFDMIILLRNIINWIPSKFTIHLLNIGCFLSLTSPQFSIHLDPILVFWGNWRRLQVRRQSHWWLYLQERSQDIIVNNSCIFINITYHLKDLI